MFEGFNEDDVDPDAWTDLDQAVQPAGGVGRDKMGFETGAMGGMGAPRTGRGVSEPAPASGTADKWAFKPEHFQQTFGAAADAADAYTKAQTVEALSQLNALKQQNAISDAEYRQRMAALQSRARPQASFLSRYGTVIVIAVVAAAGVFWVMSRRRRR